MSSNDQRKVIYQQRNELLEAQRRRRNDRRDAPGRVHRICSALTCRPEAIEEQWDVPELEEVLRNEWQLDVPLIQEMIDESNSIRRGRRSAEAVLAAADEAYEAKVELVGRESFSGFERSIMLQTLDTHWREHLAALDHLRQGIHLRGYAQKNPKQEYKREAFELFAAMLDADQERSHARRHERADPVAGRAGSRPPNSSKSRAATSKTCSSSTPNSPKRAAAPVAAEAPPPP